MSITSRSTKSVHFTPDSNGLDEKGENPPKSFGTESLFPLVDQKKWKEIDKMLDAGFVKSAQLTERRNKPAANESVLELIIRSGQYDLVCKLTEPERVLVMPEHLAVANGRDP